MSFRLSLNFAAIFLAIGIAMPFWPVWLESRGMSAAEIGLLLAVGSWIRIVSNPLIAQAVDRHGHRRRALIALSAGAFTFYLLFFLPGGFWWLFAVTALAGVFFGAIVPIADNLTMLAVQAHRLDYGRIRLWGSITFILAAIGGGILLLGRSADLILWLMCGAFAVATVASFALPEIDAPRAQPRQVAALRLLRNRDYLLVLVACGVPQLSHVVMYGFGTLHWRSLGIPEDVIGWLWAEAVIAEIVLFAVSGALAARLGALRLLVLAGLAGLVRWTLTAIADDPIELVLLQPLHAFTFAAAHIATMHLIVRAVSPAFGATAQGLYSALAIGAGMAVMMPIAGWLFTRLGGDAFMVMAGVSALGLVATGVLARFGSRALRD